MNVNKQRWALVVVGLCVAGVILATLGRFVYEICSRCPVVCPWFERIGAVLVGGVLVFALIGYCRYRVVTARARRIARRHREPFLFPLGCEKGFIRFVSSTKNV